jgi:hypothetical protein
LLYQPRKFAVVYPTIIYYESFTTELTFFYKYRLLKHPIIYSISNFTPLQVILFVNTVGIPTFNELFLTGLSRRPDGIESTETCSEHFLTGLVRRPDDGHVSAETYSENS